MTNDVKAINAAIALGDWAIPPVGTVIGVYHSWSILGGRRRSLAEVIERPADPGGTQWGIWAQYAESTLPLYISPGDSAFVVLELPEGSPPFEKWKRPGHE